MDFIIDFLIELIFEIFGEGFIYLGSAFIPQKTLSCKARRVVGAIFTIVSLIIFFGLVAGIIIIAETSGESFWGWALVVFGVLYVILAVILKIISHIKK